MSKKTEAIARENARKFLEVWSDEELERMINVETEEDKLLGFVDTYRAYRSEAGIIKSFFYALIGASGTRQIKKELALQRQLTIWELERRRNVAKK